MRILKAGICYFILVFGAGFFLGPLRLLWLVPRVGEVTAELIESPVMFVVIFFAARWIVRRYAQNGPGYERLGIGCIALCLLLSFEVTLTPYLWGVTFVEYIKGRDPIANAAFAVMLLIFALMPTFIARGSGKEQDRSS